MKMQLHDIALLFQWSCMIASAVFSIKLIGNKNTPEYMNRFYLYSIVAGLGCLFTVLQKKLPFVSKNTFGFIQNSLLVFHFIFLSVFMYKVLPNKKILKYVKPLFLVFLSVVLICIYFFTTDFSKPVYPAFTFANFGLVIFCCFYYFEIFESMPKLNLLKEPSFWIITGVFLCMCATIPINALRGYLFDNVSPELYLSMGNVAYFAYGSMHLFFIKAYLCTTREPIA